MKPNAARPPLFEFRKLTVLALLLASASASSAASDTWTGGTNGTWATTSNWLSGTNSPGTLTTPTVSTNTDTAIFNNNTNTTIDYSTSSLNLGSVLFTGTPGSFNIRSGPTGTGTSRLIFTLGGSVTVDSTVTNPQSLARTGLSGSTGTYTFENNASPTTATLTMGGTLASTTTGAATLILTGTNTGLNAITGAISQAGGASVLSITKNGTGTWTLGNNSHGGTTTLNAGTLGFASSNALGTGNFVVNGGTFGTAGLSTRTITNNITVGGDFTLSGVGAALPVVLNGTMDLGGATRTISLINTATIGGVISNGALTLASTGATRTLTLGGANTYTGATTVSGGTLLVNGSLGATSIVNVSLSATLGGDGSINAPVTVAAGGNLQPGTTTGVVGSLDTGLLTMGGTYIPTITGNGVNDLVNVAGAADFNGTIAPVLSGYAPALNDIFDIANWSGAFSGSPAFDFANAPLASGLDWDSSNFSTDGTLKVVASIPEPAAGLLGGIGALLALSSRRRRSARPG
ncbi:MAG: autotransporter [Verrucomicrobiales bacterium]|nr:autotransporter [Verrucomicrobiales bacterium]